MIFCSIFNPNPTFSSVTVSGLTPTHVVYAGTAGLLSGSGNLTFDGTNLSLINLTVTPGTQAYKFINFSGGTSQLCLESQTSGTNFNLNCFTKDGDGTDSLLHILRGVGSISGGVTNSEFGYFAYLGSTVAANRCIGLISGASGSGTVIPIKIYTGANTTQMVLNTDGSVSMGGALSASSFSGTIYATGAVSDGTYTVGNRITPDTGDLGTITVSGGIITGIQEAT